MADNNKAVGSLAAAKLVTLIKAETGKKYDRTGGKIDGSAEITGGLKVGMSSEFSSSIKAESEISSDMLLMAPIVALYDPAKEESVSFGVSGENAAKVTSPVSGGGVQYARLAVGTPTGDNDAATKAYVDNHAAGYEVITVTSTNVSDLGYDASEGANRYSVTFDASFDSILANLAANKPMKFNITLPDSTGGFPVSFSTGYVSALNDSDYLFTGTILKYPVVLRIGDLGSATVYLYGAYLPEPNPDDSDDGKSLVVNGHKWTMKKAAVDDAMSSTSTNPVQNKVIKQYVDNNAAGAGAVRYDAAQTLDEAQQFQARKNIGAIGHNSPQFQGFLSLAPANAPLETGVGLSPSRNGNNFALDISDVNENTPTLLTGVKTPTDTDTNAAATVEYVKNKVSEVSPGGGVTVDTAMSDTSTNPVQNKVIKQYVDDHAVSLPLTLTYANGQATGASYSEIRKAIESGRQIKLAVANTIDIIASNARNETNKSVLMFTNTGVGGDTVNISQYTVTAQASGLTCNVKSHELRIRK